MSKRTCRQVLVLQDRPLLRPAADDDFVKLLYYAKLCYAFEEKLLSFPAVIL